ncbi:MAG: ATP-binding protein, partial [Desulfobacula sp.]|nr:ATP-binding protein [Desulfobacula sp.]
PWPMGAIIHECGKLFKIGIPSQITFSITDNIEPDNIVLADKTQLFQVIMNLFTNALHAIGDSPGSISLSLRTGVIISEDDLSILLEPKSYYILAVKDTGCGIEKRQLSRIFEPYFTTKSTGKGSGMGLAIAHGIIKNHGGEIIVSSVPQKGSTFTLYLPVHTSSISPNNAPSTDIPLYGNETILLVDDEEHLLNIGKKYLTRIGYTVHIEADPVAALNTFKNRSDDFHLIITDKKMPKMSGDLLKDNIKKIRPDIPVILCSGFANESKNIGYDMILTKPVKNKTLGKAVRSLLDMNSATGH